MERSKGIHEIISAWDHPAWAQAWQETAGIIDDIENEQIPEFKEITEDDKFGSAELYLTHIERCRPDSPQVTEAWRYFLDDTRTAALEVLKKRGHISITSSFWNRTNRAAMVADRSVAWVSARGLANPHLINAEFIRRSVELNVAVFLDILDSQEVLGEDKALVWVSPYAHDMADALAVNWGYDTKDQKFMVRWVERDGNIRVMKQLSMRASDLSRLSQTYYKLGVAEASEQLSATGILATPLIVNKADFPYGPADIARLIDNGEQFLGGSPNGDTYESIETNSIQRELDLTEHIADLAQHILIIAQANVSNLISSEQARRDYKQAISNFVDQVAEQNPELAREAIGDKAADLYLQANLDIAYGNNQDAQMRRAQASESTNDLYLCGMRIEAQRVQSMLDLLPKTCPEFKVGQEVVCPSCRRAQIIRSANLTKQRLYCANGKCDLAQVTRKTAKLDYKPRPKTKPKPKLVNLFGFVKS